jgi:hypothetical protein
MAFAFVCYSHVDAANASSYLQIEGRAGPFRFSHSKSVFLSMIALFRIACKRIVDRSEFRKHKPLRAIHKA